MLKCLKTLATSYYHQENMWGKRKRTREDGGQWKGEAVDYDNNGDADKWWWQKWRARERMSLEGDEGNEKEPEGNESKEEWGARQWERKNVEA